MDISSNKPVWRRSGRIVFFLLALLILLAVFRHQPDIDEPQNLHLSYGWVEGEIPYRDRFDNHAPLLSIVSAPLAAAAGKTPHIVTLARLAQLPIAAATLWIFFLIARRVSGEGVAGLAVLLCVAFADWSLKMIEFRPDVLWAFFWFFSLWLLLRQLPDPRPVGVLGVGLCLGLALCTSIKTTFLVPALGLGCLVAWFASPELRKQIPPLRALTLAALMALGFFVPPLLLLGLFLDFGTPAEQIWFCLVEINRLPIEPLRVAAFAVLLPLVILVGWWIGRREGASMFGILIVTAGFYLAALFGFAPEMRKQTFLVVTPLVVLLSCHAAFLIRPVWVPRLAAAAVLFGFGIHFVFESRLWNDGMHSQRELLADGIQHVDTDEFLLDGRGETIFFDRPVYLAYVQIVTHKIDQEQLPQPDVTKLREAPTAMTIGSLSGLPKSLRKFIDAHYLKDADGHLRAAGQHLEVQEKSGNWFAQADLFLPGDYVLVRGEDILSTFVVDTPGVQRIPLGSTGEAATLVWKEAWMEGFRPVVK